MATQINFPTDPNDGDIHTENGYSWTYTLNAGWNKMPVPVFTLSTLPDVTIAGQIIWVSDATPPAHAASNGTVWNVIGTDITIV